MIKSKKQRTKYRLNDLYPGLTGNKDDMTFESGFAVNIASSLSTVSRLNNQIEMSPTMKARTKLSQNAELKEIVLSQFPSKEPKVASLYDRAI